MESNGDFCQSVKGLVLVFNIFALDRCSLHCFGYSEGFVS